MLSVIPILTAQDDNYRLVVNKQTQQLFEEKKWKSVIILGEDALTKGLDFYELRYRLGVAHYEQKAYWASIPHFEKALTWAEEDVFTLEYLYYAYSLTGRTDDAIRLSAEFSEQLINKVKKQAKRPLDWIYLEQGTKRSSLSLDTIGHLNYSTLIFHQQLGYRLDLTHGLSYIKTDYFNTDIQQYDYFLCANYQLKCGLSLTGNIHYQWIDGKLKDGSTTGDVQNFFDERDWIIHLGASKSLDRWKVGLYEQFIQTKIIDQTLENESNVLRFLQLGVPLSYTPNILDNRLTVFGESALSIRSDTTNFMWKIGTTYQATDKFNVQMTFHRIGTTYYTENDGDYYTNTIGTTDYKWSVLTNYQISPIINWYASYQYEPKREVSFNYYYHTFLTGLKISL